MHGLAALVEALHVGDGLLRDEEDVLAHRTADGHHDGRGPVQVVARGIVGPAVAQVGHVAQPHEAPVGGGLQHDVAQFVGPVVLVAGTDGELLGLGAHLAAGDVDVGGAHPQGGLGEGDALGAQVLLAEGDLDLLLGQPLQLHLADALDGPQVVLHPPGDGLQRTQVHVLTAQGEAHGRPDVLDGEGAHRLHALGQRGDAVHGVLHVDEHVVRVVALDHLHGDHPAVLLAHGADALHAGDATDLVLDAQHHALLHLLRRGTGIDHLHLDGAALDLRKEGRAHVLEPEEAEDEEEHQHGVGQHRILDEVAYRALHRPPLRGATRMPGWAALNRSVSTCCPSWRPRTTARSRPACTTSTSAHVRALSCTRYTLPSSCTA